MSRYETGVHEPPFAIAERIAKVLKIPVAFLYCPEDDLAALLLRWAEMSRTERKRFTALLLQ
jgi:transcriptional regulator with XRE-family HTH domain